MGLSLQEQYALADQVGHEAFQLIVKRMQAIGDAPFAEIIQAVTLASEVCMANALRPAIEMAADRAESADALTELAGNHVRELVEPIVQQRKLN